MKEYIDIVQNTMTALERIEYQERNKHIFEELSKPTPSHLLVKDKNYDDYGWDETLEEQLSYITLEEGVRDDYEPGDIIMPKRFKNEVGNFINLPHRILVITSSKNNNSETEYTGFFMSSKINKANKNNGYVNNIYVDSFNSILSTSKISDDKPCIVQVDEIVSCTSNDLSSGSLKGNASSDFINFINECRKNFETNQGKNKTMTWENR